MTVNFDHPFIEPDLESLLRARIEGGNTQLEENQYSRKS